MKPRVGRTPQTWRDLEESANYIAKDNLDAAVRFYDAAEEAFDSIARMPEMGAPRAFANPKIGTIRMLPVPGFENWLIFYRPIGAGIEVVRVLHSSRDIAALFGEP